jgi:Uma2 family endonuclease
MKTPAAILRKPQRGEPVWPLAELYPLQGAWQEEEYLALETNRLVEFDDGIIEVLPVPTDLHQAIQMYLSYVLYAFVEAGQFGKVRLAGLRVRLWARKYRQPDIAFLLAEHDKRRGQAYWKGADLVMEIVSDDPDDRKRDLVEKRRDYAKGRIPEYWTVDPKESVITVLRLSGTKYVEAGRYGVKDKAKSVVLKGFEVDVRTVFSQQ